MQNDSFSDIGKVEAIRLLFEPSGFSLAAPIFEPANGSAVRLASRFFQEGLDFDLTYFPLRHLGYKAVVAVTGELFAALAHPRTLSVRLGLSAKFSFASVQELWEGMVSAAKEYAYVSLDLDLLPCANGLSISVSALGESLLLTRKRQPKPKSMDLLCVSGSLGAAFLGLQVLEREKKRFVSGSPQPADPSSRSEAPGNSRPDHPDAAGSRPDHPNMAGFHPDRPDHTDTAGSRPDRPDTAGSQPDSPAVFQPDLEKYKMLVGSYLKPELSASVLRHLEDAEVYPSLGTLVTHGLSDAVKRLASVSGLGAKIYADKIPFEGNTFALGKELDIDPISAAMNGGDDFRLLFAIPILRSEQFRRDFQTFDIIGHLARPEAGTVLVTPDGAELPLCAQGWPEAD